MSDLFTQTAAEFSSDRRYRYMLSRIWDEMLPYVNFVMLNPSTADEVTNDPTVERCERRARADGFGGLIVTNLFALWSTDPTALYEADDPVGADNDACIHFWARRAGRVICAWGTHGACMERGRNVAQALVAEGVTLYALKMCAIGEPGHPLYLSYDVVPFVWKLGKVGGEDANAHH
ncbi:MAG TPA: DUF1643 domain-containing protein [Armatimonadota bacterium]|jgi:hypothetical protein